METKYGRLINKELKAIDKMLLRPEEISEGNKDLEIAVANDNASEYTLAGAAGTFLTGLVSGMALNQIRVDNSGLMEYITNHPEQTLGALFLGGASVAMFALAEYERRVADKLRK
ncbi:MAG: hypothetical protein WC781_04835 [Candidatus Pacearchaeota archaeon]|jgi:hypothetical protein